MTRTRRCIVIAFILILLNVMLSIGRTRSNFDFTPDESDHWQLTITATIPPTFDRYQIDIPDISHESEEIVVDQGVATIDRTDPHRRKLVWERISVLDSIVELKYSIHSLIQADRPVSHPYPDDLAAEQTIECQHPAIEMRADECCQATKSVRNQVLSFWSYVSRLPISSIHRGSAVECEHSGQGDALSKSQLLVALCRQRNIPARIVSGLHLMPGVQTRLHYWAEIYVDGRWLTFCPNTSFRSDTTPVNWFVISRGRIAAVDENAIQAVSTIYELYSSDLHDSTSMCMLDRFYRWLSPLRLRAQDRSMLSLLLMMPFAITVVVIVRNCIGGTTFGTFTPALLGIAFREWPGGVGMIIFLCIIALGWGLRRGLASLHLLQVPRLGVMLTCVAFLLLMFVLSAHQYGKHYEYVSLFPLVIMTGMIERIWTLEEEDGTARTLLTLFTTVALAGLIGFITSRLVIVEWMLNFPETILTLLAIQLVVGRYSGYRLLELYRFRHLPDYHTHP